MSSSAFWTRQHGCPETFDPGERAAVQLDGHVGSFPRRRDALRYARARRRRRAGRGAGARGRPRARRAGRARARRSPAGSAARTSRSSTPRTPAPCSATRSSPSSTTAAASRSSTTRRAASASAASPATSRPASGSRRRRSGPGGFAERVRAQAWVELPDDWPDWRGTMVEPLACVLRGARAGAARAACSIVGNGFIGRLFGAVLERRGDEVFAVDVDPRRAGRAPDGPVDAVVLSGRGGVETALDAVAPGGTVLVFADAGPIPAVGRLPPRADGRRVALGDAAHMPEAVALLHELDVPEPTVLPLERFAEGLELFRRRDALKVVFTPVRALALPRPGRPPPRGRPRAGPGDGRRPRPGRGRAHRRHRPEGVPPRAPGAARPAAEPVRARGLRRRRRDRTPRRRRELRAVRRVRRRARAGRRRSARTSSRC